MAATKLVSRSLHTLRRPPAHCSALATPMVRLLGSWSCESETTCALLKPRFIARRFGSQAAISKLPLRTTTRVIPTGGATQLFGTSTCRIDLEEAEHPVTMPTKEEERQEFISVCHVLKQEILDSMQQEHCMPQEAIDWVQKVIEYNCIGGKLNRGISVIHCAQALATDGELTPEMRTKASILGWCIEWLQAFFLVADDIMDNSLMRRGQPCWYRDPKVQLIAINDAFLLETFVYQILKRHFQHDACYLQLVELFHEIVYKTELGQLLDLTSQPQDAEMDLSRFTVERYHQIVINKTAYYTFYLSVACAMYLRGVTNAASYALAQRICLQIGEYFQIQDDFLDCFGDAQVIGKVGTDIQDNKCSWLVVQALDRATSEQKQILKENYGRDDPECIANVKKLYQDLNLPAVFHEYEDRVHAELCQQIAQVQDMPSEVFTMLLNKIFKRNK